MLNLKKGKSSLVCSNSQIINNGIVIMLTWEVKASIRRGYRILVQEVLYHRYISFWYHASWMKAGNYFALLYTLGEGAGP